LLASWNGEALGTVLWSRGTALVPQKESIVGYRLVQIGTQESLFWISDKNSLGPVGIQKHVLNLRQIITVVVQIFQIVELGIVRQECGSILGLPVWGTHDAPKELFPCRTSHLWYAKKYQSKLFDDNRTPIPMTRIFAYDAIGRQNLQC
jgi:hypothetical protein